MNTNGSALHNPGKIGGGSILRNDYGNIIYAFCIPFGEGSNNQAEVQAATYGLNRCIQHGFRNIILEVDSELLTKWLSQKDKPPWRIQRFIKDLQLLTNQCTVFSCVHVYRKSNNTTDILAKHSHNQDIIQHYYTYNHLP